MRLSLQTCELNHSQTSSLQQDFEMADLFGRPDDYTDAQELQLPSPPPRSDATPTPPPDINSLGFGNSADDAQESADGAQESADDDPFAESAAATASAAAAAAAATTGAATTGAAGTVPAVRRIPKTGPWSRVLNIAFMEAAVGSLEAGLYDTHRHKFNNEAYTYIVNCLEERFRQWSFATSSILNKCDTERKRFRMYKTVLSYTGTSVEDGIVQASDDIWEKFLSRYPSHAWLRTKPLAYDGDVEKYELLFPGTEGTGQNIKTAAQALARHIDSPVSQRLALLSVYLLSCEILTLSPQVIYNPVLGIINISTINSGPPYQT